MMTNPAIEFLQHLRQSFDDAEMTDAQLLEAFIRQRDSQALDCLVRRHAPMVWGICRRTLANLHDAEDAFQATFLVLVRRAASIRSRELVVHWLYRVAYKTACKARQMAAKRAGPTKPPMDMPEPKTESHDRQLGPELQTLLNQELSALPEKYGIILVLSALEGRSRREVAQQLRLPEGTVASRLARGRAMLAKRLARRGIEVSATALAGAIAQQTASGSVPAVLLTNTVKVAAGLAAGEATAAGVTSTQVSSLTEGVLKTMARAKRTAAALGLLIAAFALAGGMLAYHQLKRGDGGGVAVKNPDDPDEVKEVGSAEGAISRVIELNAARLAGKPGLPEMWQFVTSVSLPAWKEPAAKRSSDRLTPSQKGKYSGFIPLEAKLDRKKREWTVSGVIEVGNPAPGPAWEMDWNWVVRYIPSTGGNPGGYDLVSEEYFGANGERIPDGRFGNYGFLGPFCDPVRYGLRPVGTKDSTGDKR
jgi:RNA polymerase sigma factor (sigma-70 family)